MSFELWKNGSLILREKYQSAGGTVTINISPVVEKLLCVSIPTTPVFNQQTAVGDFTAIIDGTEVPFRVIKGGVESMSVPAATFLANRFLTWQPQEKQVLQNQREYLTFYATVDCRIRCTVYLTDNTSQTVLFDLISGTTDPGLITCEVSWPVIRAMVTQNFHAWDITLVAASGQPLTSVQRYRLRTAGEEEHLFIWTNTLGGIDTISFTGRCEYDRKLEHLVAQLYDGTLDEYQVNKKGEYKQSTGYLTQREAAWTEDFFYSQNRYKVMSDGAVKPVVLVSSKVLTSTSNDLSDFEFSYKMASDSPLLNLDIPEDLIPVPEAPGDLFFTELLSSLLTATYSEDLLIAVQKRFASSWMKLSLGELWSSALPLLIDGKSIRLVDGKLQVAQNRYSDYGLTEPCDGQRAVFSTSRQYVPGSVRLFLNGVRQSRGYDADYIEEPDVGKIRLWVPPGSDDRLVCDFMVLQ